MFLIFLLLILIIITYVYVITDPLLFLNFWWNIYEKVLLIYMVKNSTFDEKQVLPHRGILCHLYSILFDFSPLLWNSNKEITLLITQCY